MTKHALIFIHGMGVGEPGESYTNLWNLIASHYEKIHGLAAGEFEQRFQMVPINYNDVTYEAKQAIYESAFPDLEVDQPSQWDVLHPIRALRYFVTFYLGDVTAYVSENDNNIRSSFWYQAKAAIFNQPYSIIAHSLGSIIAFDFLYNLLESHELFLPVPDQPTISYQNEVAQFEENFAQIKSNFRNFYTFGSTIGLFMMRKGTLWKDGAAFANIINPIQRTDDQQQVWLNFYDKEDILSYPLENLFLRNPKNQNRVLQDAKLQTGNLIVDSHTSYWQNHKMAEGIASSLPA